MTTTSAKPFKRNDSSKPVDGAWRVRLPDNTGQRAVSATMDTIRSVVEIGFGVLLAVGAVFNATYTLNNGAEFYRSFADGAWLPPARQMIERVVIPNATVVTVGLVLFEATAAALILLRGDLVQPALVAGGVFALVAAAASSPAGTIANLSLATISLILAFTR